MPTPVKYDSHGTWESNNYHGLGWKAKHEWAKALEGDQPAEDEDIVREPAEARKRQSWPTPLTPGFRGGSGAPKDLNERLGLAPAGSRQRKTYPAPIKADSSVGKNLLTLQKVENGDGAFNMLAREVRREEMVAAGTFFSDPSAVSGITERTARTWPTPVKNEARAAAYTPETSRRHFLTGSNQVHLAQAVRDPLMYPTPTASDQGRRPPEQLRRTGRGMLVSDTGTFTQLSLGSVAKAEVRERRTWSTPTVAQIKVPTASVRARLADPDRSGRNAVPLVEAVQRETLAAHDAEGRDPIPTPMTKGLRGGSQSEHWPGKWKEPGHPEYGELNPDWVEWIMGWPIGWTSLAPLGRESFDDWLRGVGADPATGLPTWWAEDPSDDPASGIPKTVRPAGKAENAVRVSRIAALGNGQVSAACAGAAVLLSRLDDDAPV